MHKQTQQIIIYKCNSFIVFGVCTSAIDIANRMGIFQCSPDTRYGKSPHSSEKVIFPNSLQMTRFFRFLYLYRRIVQTCISSMLSRYHLLVRSHRLANISSPRFHKYIFDLSNLICGCGRTGVNGQKLLVIIESKAFIIVLMRSFYWSPHGLKFYIVKAHSNYHRLSSVSVLEFGTIHIVTFWYFSSIIVMGMHDEQKLTMAEI